MALGALPNAAALCCGAPIIVALSAGSEQAASLCAPQPPLSAPQPPLSAPQPPLNSPRAPLDSPHAPLDSPQAPLSAPQAPNNETRTPWRSPRAPLDLPRTPNEYPRTPLRSPRAPLRSPRTPLSSPRTPLRSPRSPNEYSRTPNKYSRISALWTPIPTDNTRTRWQSRLSATNSSLATLYQLRCMRATRADPFPAPCGGGTSLDSGRMSVGTTSLPAAGTRAIATFTVVV